MLLPLPRSRKRNVNYERKKLNDLVWIKTKHGGPYSHGMLYRNYQFEGYPDGRAAYEVGDTSVKLDGTPNLVLAEGQVKYNSCELFANVWAKSTELLRVEERNHDAYVRLQVWLAPGDDVHTAEALEHLASQIRANAAAKEQHT